jgi:predicted ABC-type transport system involved in lysophospholipase L1 biosynthesis ATPase subunit
MSAAPARIGIMALNAAAAKPDLLLELSGVAKGYRERPGAEPLWVLQGLDLELHDGESIAIVGASGSGKSTLLNIIGTLDRPDAGRVTLRGRELTALGEAELAALRSRELGFIFQLHHLLPQCTVLENVLVPTLAAGDRPRHEEPGERARRLLERVGLAERLSHRPGQLSGGERQRVAVVRALINEPRLLLADEPTGSLDDAASENLARLLVELNQEEAVALIVVTHAMPLAARMARAFELRRGTLAPLGETR